MHAADETLKALGHAELERLKGELRRGSIHSEILARILRAHLLVEVCMRRHIEAQNPGLGSLEPRDFNFARLRTMFVGLTETLPWAATPLADLNKIRNRFAHRLDAAIRPEDLRSIVDIFCSDGSVDRAGLEADPAGAVEAFAILFGLNVAVMEHATKTLAEIEARQRVVHEEAMDLLTEILGKGDNGDV